MNRPNYQGRGSNDSNRPNHQRRGSNDSNNTAAAQARRDRASTSTSTGSKQPTRQPTPPTRISRNTSTSSNTNTNTNGSKEQQTKNNGGEMKPTTSLATPIRASTTPTPTLPKALVSPEPPAAAPPKPPPTNESPSTAEVCCWESHYSEKYQREYYYNPADSRVSWFAPNVSLLWLHKEAEEEEEKYDNDTSLLDDEDNVVLEQDDSHWNHNYLAALRATMKQHGLVLMQDYLPQTGRRVYQALCRDLPHSATQLYHQMACCVDDLPSAARQILATVNWSNVSRSHLVRRVLILTWILVACLAFQKWRGSISGNVVVVEEAVILPSTKLIVAPPSRTLYTNLTLMTVAPNPPPLTRIQAKDVNYHVSLSWFLNGDEMLPSLMPSRAWDTLGQQVKEATAPSTALSTTQSPARGMRARRHEQTQQMMRKQIVMMQRMNHRRRGFMTPPFLQKLAQQFVSFQRRYRSDEQEKQPMAGTTESTPHA
ncbi:hypothetical protein ACA910_020231 [Epithemia clementina (nom. ined.)]